MYNLLIQKGYKVYEATDGSSALRIVRRVHPHLVLIDVNIWGIGAYELARIIEKDNLSTAIFITNNPNQGFKEELSKMKIFAYIMKPLNPAYFHQIIEFSLKNMKKVTVLEAKVEKLEKSLTSRKKVEKAKGILMEKMNLSEEEAYQFMRRKSMDQCSTMDIIAEEIMNQESSQ